MILSLSLLQGLPSALSPRTYLLWKLFCGLPFFALYDRSAFRTQSNIYDGAFCNNSQYLPFLKYFGKKFHRRCLTRFWMCLCIIWFFFLWYTGPKINRLEKCCFILQKNACLKMLQLDLIFFHFSTIRFSFEPLSVLSFLSQ